MEIEWVSWYDSRARRNHDLRGYWDALAGKDGKPYLIQATSRSNHSTRVKKCSEPEAMSYSAAIGAVNLVVSFEHEWDLHPKQTVII